MLNSRDGAYRPARRWITPREADALRADNRALLDQLVAAREHIEERFLAVYELGRRDERGACTWRLVVDGATAMRLAPAYAEAVYEVWRTRAARVELEQWCDGQWRTVRANNQKASE